MWLDKNKNLEIIQLLSNELLRSVSHTLSKYKVGIRRITLQKRRKILILVQTLEIP